MVLHIGEERIRDLLHWDQLIPAMETALVGFSLGRAVQPVRQMLTIEDGKRYLGVMPAVADGAMGAKLVSFYPGNAGTGLPTHLAMILLFRPDTGEPLAVMDGRLITEMRTAAVSAAVTKRLSAPDSRVLALLGSGVQARAHLQALSRVRHFEEVRVWSRTADHAACFAEQNDAKAVTIEEAVRDADVIVTATNEAGADPQGRLAQAGSARQWRWLTAAHLAGAR
jgi:thiomorpholine-carboxylate dehydrogenase